MAAFLGQVGRREIDGDALGRQGEARGQKRGADPLAAFGDGLVGQPDQHEGDAARRDLDLNVDGARLDALERHRRDPRHHFGSAPLPLGKLAKLQRQRKNISGTRQAKKKRRPRLLFSRQASTPRPIWQATPVPPRPQ